MNRLEFMKLLYDLGYDAGLKVGEIYSMHWDAYFKINDLDNHFDVLLTLIQFERKQAEQLGNYNAKSAVRKTLGIYV